MPEPLHKLVGHRPDPIPGRTTLAKLIPAAPEPVRDARGHVIVAATLIKAAHAAGPRRLAK